MLSNQQLANMAHDFITLSACAGRIPSFEGFYIGVIGFINDEQAPSQEEWKGYIHSLDVQVQIAWKHARQVFKVIAKNV